MTNNKEHFQQPYLSISYNERLKLFKNIIKNHAVNGRTSDNGL